ncbi:MAG TPA: S8 family serine peptidase, partial [Thermoplasmata archaeon]|nr:S8 family serine peptidase [Thermoplasmata archaeon]
MPFLPQYKVQPGLAAVSGSTPLLIDVFPWESYLPLVASIVSNGGKVERQYQSEWHTTVSAQVDARIIPLLASLEGVRWIQRWTEPTIANKDGQWVVQSGIQDNRPIWNRSIRGEGQVVAYADTGMDWDHSFFRDPADKPPGPGARKTIGYVRWANQFGDNMGHGTHVAGTIAGNDVPVNGTSANIGNAPAAFLWVDDVSNTGGDWEAPQDLNPLYEKSFNGSSNSSTGEGARLHSNSWGWPSEHNYTMVAATTDEFMWNHQDYLVVIAAGNERGAGMNSLRSPGLAKNIVTVGATENGMTAQDMAGFSSTGPTQGDGRLKPTVCAPGVNIRSAMSDSDTTTKNSGETQMSGTSMATPTTAGALALLRQYFREGWYPSGTKTASDALTPSAPLMKATLMAGAVEISGAGTDSLNEGVFPNNSQGWGRVTLENSLFFDGDARKLWVKDDRTGVQTGANLTFKVKVNGVNEPLRVILAWSDAPGAVYSNPSIVNDLDLIVTSPGATYLGNRFAGKSPGHSVVGGMQDRVNVEEGVILPDATNGLVAGEYTINVVGQNVPTGPQPFALVVVGDIEGQAAVASVTIAPPTANVEVAKSAQFQARALDTAGNDVPGAKFTFTVTPPTLGTAADLGNGTAGFTAGTKTGTGVLTATASGKTANATITVTAGPIATLTVEPGTISMAVKGTAPARAVGKDQYGNDATPASVVWTVSVGLDATVTGSGASISLLAGTRSGTGEITADAVGKSAKATVNIAPGPPKKLEVPQSIDTVVGTNVSVSARVLDEYGNEIKSATATWATASGLGTFSPSTGLTVKFKAGTKAGNASFSVTSGALIEVRDLAVVPGPPAKITVIPDRVVLDPQGTKDLTAAVFDQYGNNISNASVKWEAPSFATVIPGEGYKVTIASEAIGGAQGVLYARVDAVQAQVPVTVNAF